LQPGCAAILESHVANELTALSAINIGWVEPQVVSAGMFDVL